MLNRITTKALFDCTHTIANELFEQTTYPWEVLDKIGEFIMAVGPTLPKEKYDSSRE